MCAAGAAGAAAGASAAAAAARHARMEEEEMTPYSAADLEGWEFKILRTAGKTFKDQRQFEVALEQEAQAGWELVEKFDDHRVRLKRRVEMREKDSLLDWDPYRTWVGTSQAQVAAIILLVCGLVIGLIFVLAAAFSS